MQRTLVLCLFLVIIPLAGGMCPTQSPDPNCDTTVVSPRYPAGDGPEILIDCAHDNGHCAQSTYTCFADLARSDGYQVADLFETLDVFDLSSFSGLLMIANPGSPLPQGEEVIARDWIMNGGCGWLITDHSPLPLNILDLALSFGVQVQNVVALGDGSTHCPPGTSVCAAQELSMVPDPDPMLSGIPYVTTTSAGSAFTFSGAHPWTPLLTIPPNVTDGINGPPVAGLQLGISNVGNGWLLFAAEASAWTAQVMASGKLTGFSSPAAPHNRQAVLNILHEMDDLCME